MKNNLFFLALIAILTNGCSADRVPVQSPNSIPPSDLFGITNNANHIYLSWTDNSTDETGFRIEQKIGSANYDVLSTTDPDIDNYLGDIALIPNTTYTYRVCAFNSSGILSEYTNEVILTTNSNIATPGIVLNSIVSYNNNSATISGSVLGDGGAPVTARGVVWSKDPNPTIALSTKTVEGSGLGNFTSTITGLDFSTFYHVYTYATNSAGTSYSNAYGFTTLNGGPNVTDVDGNLYESVTICSKAWTNSNLNVSKYTDGTLIPQVTDLYQWDNLTTGAWCYYNNDPAMGAIYGKLYNWYAIMGIYDSASLTNPTLRKKLAPIGWHIPTDNEWTTMVDCLGGIDVAGGSMKVFGSYTYWQSPNLGASNSSGFTAYGGGMRNWVGNYMGFKEKWITGNWWTSTEQSPMDSGCCELHFYSDDVVMQGADKRAGLSVRCIKD